jgi:hypothetical protein
MNVDKNNSASNRVNICFQNQFESHTESQKGRVLLMAGLGTHRYTEWLFSVTEVE